MSNTSIPYTPGLTFEEVWAMFKETDKKFQETDKKFQETDRKFQETDRKFQETDKKFLKTDTKFLETDKKFLETDKKFLETAKEIEATNQEIKEIGREIKELKATFERYAEERQEAAKKLDAQIHETSMEVSKLSKAIGELSNRFGEVAEHLVAPGIVARLNELGYHFNTVFERGFQVSENGQVVTEVDVLLENEKTIAVVEIKIKPSVHDVRKHLKRMGMVRRHYEHLRDTRKIFIGGIAGTVFPNTVKNAAIEAGFFVFTPSGDTITIDVPKDFKPREF